MNERELLEQEVWLRAYTAAITGGMHAHERTECANLAVEAFRQRWPAPAATQLDQITDRLNGGPRRTSDTQVTP